MKQAHLCAAALAPLILACPAAAQRVQTGPEDGHQVGEIVVVGALTDVVVSRPELQSTQANDLQDIFRPTPSVAVGGSDGLTLNIGYAKAFRGKEIGDAFTLESRPGRISLAPGLQPEIVGNFEVGLAWTYEGWTASAVYFDMTIDDVILDQLGAGPAPQTSTYYENVGRYESDAWNFESAMPKAPGPWTPIITATTPC